MKDDKNEEKNRKIKSRVLNILIIVFLIAMIISLSEIVKWIDDTKKTSEIVEKISENVEVVVQEEDENEVIKYKYEIDFEELKNMNPDVVAWLKVNGTTIELPIVKGEDNDYYLKHSIDRTYNVAGWVFADYRNKFDGTDRNIIIYGHNMKNGSMFNTLKNVINPEWYENEENYEVIFVTEEEQLEYEVFSVYQVEAKYYDTTTEFNSNEDFIEYINAAKSRSVYDFGVEVTNEDRILTLSTCANNNKYRVILHARKK